MIQQLPGVQEALLSIPSTVFIVLQSVHSIPNILRILIMKRSSIFSSVFCIYSDEHVAFGLHSADVVSRIV
jgi:hypothetical protein